MIKDINVDKSIRLVLQLAPYDYIEMLYNYENKFMLYDIIICQSLLLEKKNRQQTHFENLNVLDVNQMLNYCYSPEIIALFLKKKNYNDVKIYCLVDEFNKNYGIIWDNYIDFINNVADYVTLSKKNISSKGIGLLGILSYGNIMYGLNRDALKKETNRKRQENKLEKEMKIKIATKRQELCKDILNNYNIFKNELLKLLNND